MTTAHDARRPQDPRRAPPRVSLYTSRVHRTLRFVPQRVLLRGVVSTVTTMSVTGLDNVRDLRGPFVLVANHNSHLDTGVLVSQLPYRITGNLAVGAAADYFYRRWWVKATTSLFFNTYPIERTATGKRRERGLSQQLLREGVPILLYPEGTRSRDGRMGPFSPGAAVLCSVVDVPCVPVALVGTHEAMPVGRSWPVRGRPPVNVLVGRPMRRRVAETHREFNDRIATRIQTMLSTRTPYVVDDPSDKDRPGGSAEEAS